MDGSRHILYELPTCVIVKFKEITFAKGTKWRTDLNKILIPIVSTTIHCEKKI